MCLCVFQSQGQWDWWCLLQGEVWSTSSYVCPRTYKITHIQAHTHTHSTWIYTYTHTCFQSCPHRITQSHHLRVAIDGHYSGTDRPQRINSAFLFQTSVENPVLHCGIFSSCDGSLVTSTNNILVEKFHDNLLCLHFLNEPLTKLVQYLFSCMEREDSWYTNLSTPHVNCRTTLSRNTM